MIRLKHRLEIKALNSTCLTRRPSVVHMNHHGKCMLDLLLFNTLISSALKAASVMQSFKLF